MLREECDCGLFELADMVDALDVEFIVELSVVHGN